MLQNCSFLAELYNFEQRKIVTDALYFYLEVPNYFGHFQIVLDMVLNVKFSSEKLFLD